MKTRMKLKGRMRSYMQFSIYLGILLLFVDIAVFLINLQAGLLVLGFLAIYFAITLTMYFYNKPVLMNELVSFATEYGQIQRRLLKELDVPYCLLDDAGKIIWTNVQFETLIHQGKGYSKSLSAIFPSITKDKLPGEGEVEECQYELEYEGREFLATLKKITLNDMMSHSEIIDAADLGGYLIACFLFEETALKIALQEIDDQSLAAGLIYLDNYEESLESTEEVR